MLKRKTSPKEQVKIFKNILFDAEKAFGRPAHTINMSQFDYVNAGRLSSVFYKVFGFVNLKNAVAPSPDTSQKTANEARKLIERLVNNA